MLVGGKGGSTRFMVEYHSFPPSFCFVSRLKMYNLLSIILSFSSVFLLITAEGKLDILMPDAIAHHVSIK